MVSFLSPCVLPLVPAYLSMVTGLEVAEINAPNRSYLGRITRDTSLFIVGFSAVFILLGLVSTAVGKAVFQDHLLLTRVSGAIVLAMAVFLVGSLFLKSPWLYKERRFHPSPSRFGPFAAPVTGAAFAFGWTPCIGPVLSTVLAIAAVQGNAGEGAALLAVYSAGLGVPFLATGLAAGRLSRVFGFVKGHFTGITVASAVVLAGFGVLLTLNRLTWVTTELETLMRVVGLGRLVSLG